LQFRHRGRRGLRNCLVKTVHAEGNVDIDATEAGQLISRGVFPQYTGNKKCKKSGTSNCCSALVQAKWETRCK
jgi:hypothetical protein